MKIITFQYPIFQLLGWPILLSLISVSNLSGNTLHVGMGASFLTFDEAADLAVPGDTILVHEGVYAGGIFVADLKGTASDWIHIIAVPGETVIYDGGTNAWQFTDAAYLHIRGFIYQHQTGNGINFDDGGTYSTPAHHVIFEDCTFRDMNASGNNDLMKLSGLDSFEIRNCLFINGAAGGSGVDMVGCHDGLIINCHFENLGSNSIQAKGGTRNIRIEANFFKNGGARAVNLGGSTGLQFFRPIDAPYEAAELKVYSNIFIGSEAPVAFVGSINCEVVNNTIYLPGKWVMRILQETVDESRFPRCGYNTFRNNIVYIDNSVNVEVNIGPNTAPETFTFSNNLWFHSDDSNWGGPVLPVSDVNSIVQEDPLFLNSSAEDFDIREESPAVGSGYDVDQPVLDFIGEAFFVPRSIGAYEGGMMTGWDIIRSDSKTKLRVYPNPGNHEIKIECAEPLKGEVVINLFAMDGQEIRTFRDIFSERSLLDVSLFGVPPGSYLLKITYNGKSEEGLVLIRL